MKKENRKFFTIGLTVFLAIAACIIFFFLLFRFTELLSLFGTVYGILRPFVYGAIIAYVLYPMCLLFEKGLNKAFKKMKNRKRAYKLSRSISIFVGFIVAIAVIYVVLALILPQVYLSIVSVVNNVPDYFNRVTAFVQQYLEDNSDVMNFVNNAINQFDKSFTTYLSSITKNIGVLVTSISNGVLGVIVVTKDLFVGVVVAIYLLAGRSTFKKQLKNMIDIIFNKKLARSIKNELVFSNNVIGNFIAGKILDSAIIGVICFIAMSIIGIPYAPLVSVFVGITNIIPFFGPFIGAIPSALLILVDSPIKCLWFVIMVIVLQQFDGNILGPKILGQSTGLSSFWVLFAIILFGGAFGLLGMLVGVPIFAIIYDIAKKLLGRLERHKLEKEKIQSAMNSNDD